LLPQENETKAAAHILQALNRYDGRTSTGFHSTIPLMKELTRLGYNSIAYKLLESDRLPSWGYSIKQGATTIWERWDAFVAERGFQSSGMNSFNHYAFGSVGEWMFENILGINHDEQHPGYKHFFIYPKPGGNITWARGNFFSIQGKVVIDWKIQNAQYSLKVQIPTNTTATVYVLNSHHQQVLENGQSAKNSPGVEYMGEEKNYSVFQVDGGEYSFVVPNEKK
jgi:alpha-L-rhamnosidase